MAVEAAIFFALTVAHTELQATFLVVALSAPMVLWFSALITELSINPRASRGGTFLGRDYTGVDGQGEV